MTPYSHHIEQSMRSFFQSLRENDRRCYAALEAAKLGHGGRDGVALWLEASVFRMGCDVPHYAFRRFLSPLSSHCFFMGSGRVKADTDFSLASRKERRNKKPGAEYAGSLIDVSDESPK